MAENVVFQALYGVREEEPLCYLLKVGPRVHTYIHTYIHTYSCPSWMPLWMYSCQASPPQAPLKITVCWIMRLRALTTIMK
jgi:hypothetical protein